MTAMAMSEREWRLRQRIDDLRMQMESLRNSNNGHVAHSTKMRKELKRTREVLSDLISRGPNGAPICVYCGRAGAGKPTVCFAHDDLPKLDPAYR